MDDKQKKVTSLCYKTTDGHLKVKYSPVLTKENFGDHYLNLMNGFVNAYLQLFGGVDVLRPATQEERDLHCYVFETNDLKDREHTVKKLRQQMYDETKKMFDSILQNVFPDIQYLEACREYQQKYFFEDFSNQEDYQKAVSELSVKIRENYKDIVAQCYGSDNVSKKEEIINETKKEEK